MLVGAAQPDQDRRSSANAIKQADLRNVTHG
jgi:hypothetical protein